MPIHVGQAKELGLRWLEVSVLDAGRLWSDLLSVAILVVQWLMVIDADSDKKNGQLQGIIECWPTEADRRKKSPGAGTSLIVGGTKWKESFSMGQLQ